MRAAACRLPCSKKLYHLKLGWILSVPDKSPAPFPAKARGNDFCSQCQEKDESAHGEQGSSLLPALLPLGTCGSVLAQESRRRAKSRRSVLQGFLCWWGAARPLSMGSPCVPTLQPKATHVLHGAVAEGRAWQPSFMPSRGGAPVQQDSRSLQALRFAGRRGRPQRNRAAPHPPVRTLLVERGPCPPLQPSPARSDPAAITTHRAASRARTLP